MKIIKPVELLPCPFCGNKDLEWEVTTQFDDEESSYVRCRQCGASVDTTRHQMMIEGVDMFGQKMYRPTGIYLDRSAIDLWNRRKSDEVSSAEIRELEAHIDRLGKRLAQVMRERDAAIKDIPRACGFCKHYLGDDCLPICNNWDCKHISGVNTGWEWRGVPQEAEYE